MENIRNMLKREAKRAKLIKKCDGDHSPVDECPDPMDPSRTLKTEEIINPNPKKRAFDGIRKPCKKCGCFVRVDGDK